MTDIVIPGKFLSETGVNRKEFLVDLAVYLYEKQRLTMGQSRKLANLDQLSFQKALKERGVYMHDDALDLYEDIKSLNDAGL
jgi:predicted HTH domain antitoxin